jgi:phage terminase small subunit
MNPNRPLTTKQEQFVQHVIGGYSLADSYRLAYNSASRPATVRVEASRLAKQPHIVAAIHRQRLANEREQLKLLRDLARRVRL